MVQLIDNAHLRNNQNAQLHTYMTRRLSIIYKSRRYIPQSKWKSSIKPIYYVILTLSVDWPKKKKKNLIYCLSKDDNYLFASFVV